jgi:signal transduction histidine kinase
MPELDIDAAGLESVLEVLLTNAIQYADPMKELRHVSVGCVLTEEDGWVLYVRDNGIGMTAEQQAALFESSVDLSPSDVASSALPTIGSDVVGPTRRGIGIHLARQIIDRWSGRIWVESAPRKGSIFFFTLPAGK